MQPEQGAIRYTESFSSGPPSVFIVSLGVARGASVSLRCLRSLIQLCRDPEGLTGPDGGWVRNMSLSEV